MLNVKHLSENKFSRTQSEIKSDYNIVGTNIRMTSYQALDDLIREYLLFRGFASSLKSFDIDIKAEKEKGFRADK